MQTRYDVAIIGSGFGGASVAHTLTNAGLKTVVIERGRWADRDDGDWDARQVLIERKYRSETPVSIAQHGGEAVDEQLNELVGGMSILYGGAAFRLREKDFSRWPITYAELEPYYSAAEALLEVHGEADHDPFEPPRSAPYPFPAPELSYPARRIFEAARRLKLTPFALPVAVNTANDLRTLCVSCFTCDGFPCKIEAKNDVVTTALAGVDRGRFRLLSRVIADRLVRAGDRITGVECIDAESRERFTIEARLFVVSGGALQSPALLLRSGLDRLDGSGALGRYLMRHCNAIVGCFFPYRINPDNVNHKQICIADYYEDLRDELQTAVGIIQDMCMPPAEAVRHMAPRGFRYLAASFVSCIQSLICIAEDSPQRENGVTLLERQDPFGLPVARITHGYTADDRRRLDYLIKRARAILRRAGGWVNKVSKINSFSHAVGTVRFGVDPADSVLDPFCRFHALPNLFVVDSSFMPTSGGVNPSLTITANALRVADHIKTQFSELVGEGA